MSADLCLHHECAEHQRKEMLEGAHRAWQGLAALHTAAAHLLQKHREELSTEEVAAAVAVANAAALLINWQNAAAARKAATDLALKLGDAEEKARKAEELHRQSMARVEGEGWKA